MTRSRRQFVGGLGALLAAHALAGVGRATGAPFLGATPSSPRTPRYWLHIIPFGGIDAVYTTDPKRTNEVQPDVDVPYRGQDIVEAGRLRLGPAFAPLAPVADRITILNGVRVRTANHVTGMAQAVRLRTHVTRRTPSVLEAFAARRGSGALDVMQLGLAMPSATTPGYFGHAMPDAHGSSRSLLSEVDSTSPDDLLALARHLEREVAPMRARRRRSPAEQQTLDSFDRTTGFVRGAAAASRFRLDPWMTADLSWMNEDLQRALWLFENDLSTCVVVHVGTFTWDTHRGNASQAVLNNQLATTIARLCRELDARANRHGRLGGSTVVTIASEIGRFPKLNAIGGKDHFPQVPFMFIGPWFNGGQYGDSDRQMTSRPISTRAGTWDRSGHLVQLDDIAATVLSLIDVDALELGVQGSILPFLLG